MAYTYIPGNPKHTSGANGTITRVVLHATVSPCQPGGARAVAHYFQQPDAGGLAHYVVDPREIIQCAKENVATWHAPPNHGSLGVELCDPQSGAGSRWQDANHEAMFRLAAGLVADICDRNHLPRSYVDVAGLKAGHRGITLHHDVSRAFGQSSHVDPDQAGPFPLQHFLALVKAVGQKPAPAPAPAAPSWWHRNLKTGDSGTDVSKLQQRLKLSPVDGKFGPQTDHAVRYVQHAHGLVVDGIVGKQTAIAIG